MSVGRERFRRVMGRFATGVAIVTCDGPDGPAGLTTNAVTSVSLDPLLLLVCFDNASRTLPAVTASRRFAVNVLRADQAELARVFASKRVAREKFEAVTHTVAHGVPVLDGALAWLACDLQELRPAGDHTIGIGAVTHAEAEGDGAPLVFFGGGYARLEPTEEPDRSRRSPRGRPGAGPGRS
ncbi:MAG TPA: flavin reductase family protein [Solirubrobacteraceae bacterium]|nr:flavin reductase family protein [Solirubrobacteraceae bacterium]